MAGNKRKHDQDQPNDTYGEKSRPRTSVEARVDPTYGQRSAIPGLDDTMGADIDEDNLDYEIDINALNYLRAVRQEATGIPNLLVAPTQKQTDRSIYENGVGDYRGLYKDGAYYAAPENVEFTDDEDISVVDQNFSYFDSILSRYEALRAQLNQIPPTKSVENLDEDHPTYVGALNTSTARWWRWKMRIVDPLPAQISSMNKSTVLRLIGLLTGGNLLRRGTEIEVGVSRWAWSLLAKLPDRGQLTSEEIGVIRELGKKAVLLGMGLKDDAVLNDGMDAVEVGLDDGQEDSEIMDVVTEEETPVYLDGSADINPTEATGSVDILLEKDKCIDMDNQIDLPGVSQASEDLAAAKARILRDLDTHSSAAAMLEKASEQSATGKTYKWNTKATVDMILTVAGEVYGQRDLLEFRGTWDQISEAL